MSNANNSQLLLSEYSQCNPISQSEIIDIVLGNYYPQFRFIKSYSSNGKICIADIVIDCYPYAKKNAFSYVTSTTISLLLSQVSYIFIADLIINHSHYSLKGFDLPVFLEMRDNGHLLFARNNFEFRRKILKNKKFQFILEMKSSKRLRDFVCGKFLLEVPGHLTGDAMLVAGPLSNYNLG